MKKVPFVAPFDLGRGIKRRDDIKKFEVDLTDYVDNKTVHLNGDGKLEVIKEKCVRATNLNTLVASEGTLKQLGNTCFYGSFNATDPDVTLGAPVEFGKTNVEKSDAIRIADDITSGYQLDFNGWQVATTNEVTQYIYTRVGDGVQSGWVRSNDSGMNADGTLKDPSDWGKWVYELNLPEQPAQASSVTTSGAIVGDGSATNPIKLEFDDTIVKGPDGRYGAVAKGGLDCAAIDALPERPWKKGTTLLAKQDGECVRLTAFDSIFQEVGVGITADKTNSFTNEEYKVVVTVSNTGEGKNELTNLNIVGPANTEDYEIKDVSFTKSEADAVEQVNNLTYNIRGLKKGGTVKVKYTVVPKVLGNYQFTAAVNPNSALDKDLVNNNATLILNARTKSDPTYVPSVDCPLITATELDSNVVLQQLKPHGTTFVEVNGKQIERTNYPTNSVYSSNIFSRRNTLKGLRIRLEGASTVVGYKRPEETGFATVVNDNATTVGRSISGDSRGNLFADSDAIKRGTTGYTFVNGVLEITEDLMTFAFSCRPQGNNCKWQNYVLYAVQGINSNTITTSNVVGGTAKVEKIWANRGSIKDLSNPAKGTQLVIPATDSVNREIYLDTGLRRASTMDKLVFTVKAGTAASLNYTSTDDYAVTQVRGKTTITENSITVAADAKATDSVNTAHIQVIIEE